MRTDEIVKLFNDYMGFTPSSDQISKFSLMNQAEVEDILKNTKTDVSSEATKGVNQAIESLKGSLGQGGTDYMKNLATFQQQAGQAYGLPGVEENLKKATDWKNQLTTKGPMFEQTMTTGLQQISPTFLGATRKGLEEYFANIPNPLVRDKMVGSYLDAADKSMSANLTALNALYKTSIYAAQSAVESEKDTYTKITGKIKDLTGDLTWLMRNRYEEQIKEQEEAKKLLLEEEAGVNALDDVLQKAMDSGATPEDAATAASIYVQNNGISISLKQLNNLKARAIKMKEKALTGPVAGPVQPPSGIQESAYSTPQQKSEAATKKYFNVTGGSSSSGNFFTRLFGG